MFYHIVMTKKILGSIEQLINVVALIVSGAYITHSMLSCSAIPVRLTSVQLSQILFILYGLDILKLIKSFIKKDVTALVMFASFFLVSYLSNLVSGDEYQFLLYIPAIMFALYDIEYDRVITLFLFLIGTILIVSIFSSQINIVSNYVYNGSNKIRSSWGISYPTDYASIVLFFVMFMWTKKKKCSDLMMLFLALLSLLNASFVASSRTSIISSSLLIIGIIFYNVFQYLIARYDFSTFKKGINIFFMLSFPASALFTLIISILFEMNVPLAQTMNTLMSNRLSLLTSGAKNYGIHPFGSFFELMGGGLGGAGFYNGYNFIDNSYALIFIRYGWIYFCVLLSLWLVTMKKVLNAKNYKLAIVLSVIAVHSISEHHYMDVSFNLLLLMPFVDFKNIEVKTQNIAVENVAVITTTLIFTFLLVTVYPSLLSYLRTFVTINHIQYANSRTMEIVLPILMMFSILLFGIIYACKQTIVEILSREKAKPIYLFLLSLAVLITFIIPQYKNQIYANSYDKYLDIFETEKDVIQLIKKNKSGKLYSTDVPEYYKRYFKGFSSGILQGEELATQKNVTVITDLETDSDIFIQNSFRWVQISDYHAIYTNDENVITALENKNYQIQYYYAREHHMSIANWGYMNDISTNEYGWINVKSGENSLLTSPYCYLHVNMYQFKVNLSGLESMTENSIDYTQPIANIQVKYVGGDELLYEGQIYPLFDDSGNYTYEFQFNNWKLSNVYVSFEAINDCSVWITDVIYQKI